MAWCPAGRARVRRTRRPIVLNTARQAAAGSRTCRERFLALVIFVPIIGSNHVLGAIVLENYEREDAFGESEVRLLTTVAGG
jgi:GAF domain-containing protein